VRRTAERRRRRRAINTAHLSATYRARHHQRTPLPNDAQNNCCDFTSHPLRRSTFQSNSFRSDCNHIAIRLQSPAIRLLCEAGVYRLCAYLCFHFFTSRTAIATTLWRAFAADRLRSSPAPSFPLPSPSNQEITKKKSPTDRQSVSTRTVCAAGRRRLGPFGHWRRHVGRCDGCSRQCRQCRRRRHCTRSW
jgi:hypothetical protein